MIFLIQYTLYTKKLLGSLPSQSNKLEGIPGQIPDPINPQGVVDFILDAIIKSKHVNKIDQK